MKIIEKGEIFGEMALLYNNLWSASIKAVTDSYVYGLERHVF